MYATVCHKKIQDKCSPSILLIHPFNGLFPRQPA